MFRFCGIYTALFLFFCACAPPVRTSPKRVVTGLDTVEYAGVIEGARNLDLSGARYLAKVKVGDLGVSLDCAYPDVLNLAKQKAQSFGGNLLVITEHKRYYEKSRCHRINADVYAAPTLEGLESQILWHPKRPLRPGDLRGRPSADAPDNPPVHCTISCRLGGDYFKEFIIRTETIFWADSTYMPAKAAHQPAVLRRAQLQFDLAELHARRLKAAIHGLGPDLPAASSKFRTMTSQAQAELRAQAASLDAELAATGSDSTAVFERWESRLHGEIDRLNPYSGEVKVNLRKRKRE